MNNQSRIQKLKLQELLFEDIKNQVLEDETSRSIVDIITSYGIDKDTAACIAVEIGLTINEYE